jgi:hypothetical protein
MLRFRAHCHQTVTMIFQFGNCRAFGIDICVGVAHGCNDRRVPEQLLDCHYIHASIHEPGRESVPQRVPRNTLDPRLSTRQTEARFEINKRGPGFGVVENKFIPLA